MSTWLPTRINLPVGAANYRPLNTTLKFRVLNITGRRYFAHRKTSLQLNAETPVLPLFSDIPKHRAKSVLPLPGWQRQSRAKAGFIPSNQPNH
jgi:hypothetical protein